MGGFINSRREFTLPFARLLFTQEGNYQLIRPKVLTCKKCLSLLGW